MPQGSRFALFGALSGNSVLKLENPYSEWKKIWNPPRIWFIRFVARDSLRGTRTFWSGEMD